MRRWIHRLLRSERAAVAPTVALALFGLIAIGGVAFDYARLAAMDTELQQAADQAALAAATQLDRSDGSQARAAAAIQNPGTNRLASNLTRFAQADATSGMSVEITNISFCKTFDDTKADTTAACTAATGDSDSAFVVVTTQLRTARYALTPIVGLFSGSVTASAVAGVQSSICNIAPLLVCVGPDFPTSADIGKGLLMKPAPGNAWVPGNWGLLDFGQGNGGVIDALLGHGMDGCTETQDQTTEPGVKSVTDAINTRMDVYDGNPATRDPSACNLADGTSCPAANTRKDMASTMTYQITQDKDLPAPTSAACGTPATGNGNPNPSIAYTPFAVNGANPGFSRDSCHYAGNCTGGNIGDGNWDSATYLSTNHPGVSAATIAVAAGKAADAHLTRYDIYKWELANQGSGALDPQQIGATVSSPPVTHGNNTTYTFTKQCAFSKPFFASANYPAEKDRRVLPVVAADCTNLKGKGSAFEDFVILRVFDIFLTEPSEDRTTPGTTGNQEIYGEVIGPGDAFGSGGGFQYYARNKPYLVR